MERDLGLEAVGRVALFYVFLLIALRIVGKRHLAEMSPFELVVLMVIPEISSQAIQGEHPTIGTALVGVSSLLVLVFLTSILTYRFPWLGRIIEGCPTLLSQEGRLIPSALHQERVPAEEIATTLRREGYKSLDDIEWIVLEPNGKLSVVPRESKEKS